MFWPKKLTSVTLLPSTNGKKPCGQHPVNMMSELAQPSGSHVYIPIPWDAECVKPPYEDFYLDGCRIPPFRTGLTGYEGLR
eukprot:3551852-Amphidinium_carterae.1